MSQLLLQQHPQLHPRNSHQLGLALLVLVCELGQLLTAARGTRRGRRSLRLFVAGWPLRRRPRRLGADVVAVTVVCLLQRKVYTRGALLAEGLDRLQQASAVLLIEDADRVEIRIADLLADLKVVVAIVDERLRVLAEVERAQPLDHDVTRHGHLDALVVHAWARLRPRSFALLNPFPALARSVGVLFHRWPSLPTALLPSLDDPCPVSLSAVLGGYHLARSFFQTTRNVHRDARISSKLDSADSAYKSYPFSRFNVTFSPPRSAAILTRVVSATDDFGTYGREEGGEGEGGSEKRWLATVTFPV